MAYIIHIVSSHIWGGEEQYALDLCRRLAADGHHVHAICRGESVVAARFRDAGISVSLATLRGAIDLVGAATLARIIKSTAADMPVVVHAHKFKDAFTAAYARHLSGQKHIRIVLTRHLVRPGKTGLIYRWLYRQLDMVCFVSELARTAFYQSQPTLPRSKTCVVHNAIADDAQPGVQPVEAVPANAGPIIMFHGRLHPEKGIDVLIDALAPLRSHPFTLMLVGTGADAYVAQLKEHIAAAGLAERVQFLGFHSPVLPLLRQATFGIVPSIAAESFSLAALEYMAAGRTLIATDNGGQREFLRHHDNALLVPPADVPALTHAIERLLTDIPLRQRLAHQAATDYATHHSYATFYHSILRAYAI